MEKYVFNIFFLISSSFLFSNFNFVQNNFSLQTAFIENKGQLPSYISFYSESSKISIFVNKYKTISYFLKDSKKFFSEEFLKARQWTFSVKSKSSIKFNYFKGNNPSKFKKNIPAFEEIFLGEIWDGIELFLKSNHEGCEKVFHIKKGANPKDIRIKINGERIYVNKEGALCVGERSVYFKKPLAYQFDDNNNIEFIECSYKNFGSYYSFNIGKYDKNKDIFIDPMIVSTYIGGSLDDYAWSFDIDMDGNIYIAGFTESYDFPYVNNNLNGENDIFILKFDKDNSKIVSGAIIGGKSWDSAYKIFADKFNNLVVIGQTNSDDFPITPGAFDRKFNQFEGFILIIDNDLSNIVASTYFGGIAGANLNDVEMDSENNIVISGVATPEDFPVTHKISGRNCGDHCDVFLAKLNYNLSELIFSTFVDVHCSGCSAEIAISSKENIYLAGTMDFRYPTYRGKYIYIHKIDSILSRILNSFYIDGSLDDIVYDIKIDNTDNIIIAGETNSLDFPITGNAFDKNTSWSDGFIVKLDPDLKGIISSTYLGGIDIDNIFKIIIDYENNVYVAGNTISYDFPTTKRAFQKGHNGSIDIFISYLNSDFSQLIYSTLLGGSCGEFLEEIKINKDGNLCILGSTYSEDFPVTENAVFKKRKGKADLFFSCLTRDLSRTLHNRPF